MRWTWLVLLTACGGGHVALGQHGFPRPYDGIQAGLDAYRLAEEQRRAAIANQLFLNDQMKYWSGLPTSRGETIYYGVPHGYGYAAPLMFPANLDYTYAYAAGRGWRGYRERTTFARRAVFEPWPVVPGDIYGYTYYQGVRQPIGQHQVQTGPNRWESHPVYDPPLPLYRPLPPVAELVTEGAAELAPVPLPYRER